MITHFILFGSTEQTEAETYTDACNAEYETFLSTTPWPEPGAVWTIPWVAKTGEWVVAKYGTPAELAPGYPFVETSALAALRGSRPEVDGTHLPDRPDDE